MSRESAELSWLIWIIFEFFNVSTFFTFIPVMCLMIPWANFYVSKELSTEFLIIPTSDDTKPHLETWHEIYNKKTFLHCFEEYRSILLKLLTSTSTCLCSVSSCKYTEHCLHKLY